MQALLGSLDLTLLTPVRKLWIEAVKLCLAKSQ